MLEILRNHSCLKLKQEERLIRDAQKTFFTTTNVSTIISVRDPSINHL